MYCTLQITTNKSVKDISESLIKYFGNQYTTAEVFNQTSLQQTQEFLPIYFYGNTNHKINYLASEETEHTLRIFIENINRRENLNLLTKNVKNLVKQIQSFAKKNQIKFSEINATIWAEEDEILNGEVTKYWDQIKSFLPDIPAGIYLTTITAIYSYFKTDTTSTVKEKFIVTTINIVLVIIATIIWLFIKTLYKKRTLNFK